MRPQFLKRQCEIVQLANDGPMLEKTVTRQGGTKNRYFLNSFNADPIVDPRIAVARFLQKLRDILATI